MFANTSSEERKYWGFALFQKILKEAPQNVLCFMFSKNLTRCLINQLASRERYLNRIAEKAIKTLLDRAEAQPAVAVIAFIGLTGVHGQVGFDQVTKTKTIERLVGQFDNDGLLEVFPTLCEYVLRPETSDLKLVASQRQAVADLLVTIIKSRPSLKNDNPALAAYSESICSILNFLAKCAYFRIQDDGEDAKSAPRPEMTTTSREMFRSRLISCLTCLIDSNTDPARFTYLVVRNIHDLELNHNTCKTLLDIDSDIEKVIRKGYKTLEKIHSKEMLAPAPRKPELQAFKLLYSLSILQVYNGDTDAVNVLDELKGCYDSLIKRGADDEKDGSEALVEILLSFASKPSLLFRRLAEQVFSTFASTITPAGLQSMFKVSGLQL